MRDKITSCARRVMLIDEFTGRMMFRSAVCPTVCTKRSKRREGCRSSLRTSRSHRHFPDYFRTVYNKLAGRPVRAETEARRIAEIYGLGAVVVLRPTLPFARVDEDDQVLIVSALENTGDDRKRVKEANCDRQPVLVGSPRPSKSPKAQPRC